MRISPLILVTLLVLSAFSTCKSSRNMTETFTGKDFPFDSVVAAWLGDSVCDAFHTPSWVYAYKMRPKRAETDTLIGGYAVDYVIGKLDESCYAPLLFFLKDTANYVLSDETVKTLFSPNIGFEFASPKYGKTYLLIAFNGSQLQVVSQGRTVLHKQFKNKYFLLRFAEKLLPGNEFIKRELYRNQQK